MPRTKKTIPPEEDPNLIRGKYPKKRFPMLEEYPDIEPGMNWQENKPLPAGFRLDKSGRIWPIPVKAGRVAPAHLRCKANSKDTGEQCPAYKVTGRDTCRMHGDTEAEGILHPNVTHGGRIQNGIFGDALPPELSAWYERAIQDPGIYDLTHDIAIIAGRQREILGGLSTGEARANWKTAAELVEDLFTASKAKDYEALSKILPKLRAVTRAGRSDTGIWSEFVTLGDKKRRLIDTERKRRLDLKMVVSADQLRGLIRAFYVIVFQEINGIPATCQTLIRQEGKLDTGRLSLVLIARIGKKMTAVSQGMKSGRLSDEHINGPGGMIGG